MYWHLFDAGVPVKHLVYNKVGHGDFVVQWPLNLNTADAAAAADWGHGHTAAADDWGAGEMAAAAATAIADAAGTAAAVVSGNAAGAAAGTEAVGLGLQEGDGVHKTEPSRDGGVSGFAAAAGVYELSANTHSTGINSSSSSSKSAHAGAVSQGLRWSGDPQALSPGAGAAAGVSLLEGSIGSAAASTDELEDGRETAPRQKQGTGKEEEGNIKLGSSRGKQRAALLEVLPLHNQDIAKLVGCLVKPNFAVRR